MLFQIAAELCRSQHGVASHGQLASFGANAAVVRDWVRSGRVVRIQPGVVAIAGAPLTWRSHLAAASLSHGGDLVVVSHRASAVLHRLDGVEGPWIEVTVDRGRHVRLADAIVHRTPTLEPDDVTHVDGIRVTSVARTLADLGAVVPRDTVERALDDALRRGFRRRWIEQVLERVQRPGPSGTGTLATILDDRADLDGLAGNWFERLVISPLQDMGFDVVPQLEVRFAAGGRAFIDAAIPSLGLAVEAHSKRWHFGDRKNVLDADRDAKLAAEGWQTVYVRYSIAVRPGGVRAYVGPVATARGWHPA
jgi:hypothetical protein